MLQASFLMQQALQGWGLDTYDFSQMHCSQNFCCFLDSVCNPPITARAAAQRLVMGGKRTSCNSLSGWSVLNRQSAPSLLQEHCSTTQNNPEASPARLAMPENRPHLLGSLLQDARRLRVGCAACQQPRACFNPIGFGFSGCACPCQCSCRCPARCARVIARQGEVLAMSIIARCGGRQQLH